jgi:multiple sugar transport system ATP-binding protein
MAEIGLNRLHKRFGDFTAVQGTDLTIADGEYFALLGPSGCGKTTTLRMIAGLEMPSSGSITLDGREVAGERAGRRDIAFVFQMFALYPHMNVRDNIAYPLRSQGLPRAEIRQRVEQVARQLQLDHLLKRRISGLPGGDRQRIALARAIVRRPKAFLMDEPLGTLDAELRSLMREELRALHDRIGATTVYVTHDQVEAMSMADRIAVMQNGVVLQAAPPMEIYERPATKFVAGFVGAPAMNFLDAHGDLQPGSDRVRVAGVEVGMPALREGLDGGFAVLGIRPEHVRLVFEGGLRGTVFGSEYLGSHQLLTVDTDAGRMHVRTSYRDPIGIGATVGLALDPARTMLFDPHSERALASAAHPGGPRLAPAGLEAAHG